jgi:aryl-alcohol dehydrogenase-like predicted oxidoreductase
MEYRQLGGSGLKVPVFSLGTGTFGGTGELFSSMGNTGEQEATHLVDICLEAGLNMFDSADVYSSGLAEEILGQAIKGRRDAVLISTKATFRVGEGPNDVGSSRHHLIRAVEKSLRRLGTDYIDLFQLHGFDGLTPVEETLGTLDDLVRAGKIRYIGCSNFSADRADLAAPAPHRRHGYHWRSQRRTAPAEPRRRWLEPHPRAGGQARHRQRNPRDLSLLAPARLRRAEPVSRFITAVT